VLDELADEQTPEVYRLFDLLEWMRHRGKLSDIDYLRLLVHAKHRSSGLCDFDAAIREKGLFIPIAMLEFLRSLELFQSVVDNIRIYVSRTDAHAVRQKVHAFEKLEEVWEWNHQLWTRLQGDSRCSFETASDLDAADGDDPGGSIRISIAAATLATKKRLPLLADDRCCQMMVLNTEPRAEQVAFGTDLVVEEIAAAGLITAEQLANVYMQLIEWRYRFLLVPAHVLKTLALRHQSSAPGEPLERIAVYVHDCMTDPGLFCGAEPTEPKVSMAMFLSLRWTEVISQFVVLLWGGADFSDVQATAFTNWALTEVLPTPPACLSLSEQFNLATKIQELVVSRILIARSMVPDKSRSGRMMGAIQDALGMERGEFCRIVARVAEIVSRRQADE
jgi:hypothetical protein